jgi:hypothetical protein
VRTIAGCLELSEDGDGESRRAWAARSVSRTAIGVPVASAGWGTTTTFTRPVGPRRGLTGGPVERRRVVGVSSLWPPQPATPFHFP